MLYFNNNHIVTGYIKQLLASFNLPKYRVYSAENARYYSEYKREKDNIVESIEKTKENTPNDMCYIHYIKDGYIQRYVDGKWKMTDKHYHYNKKELNYTKNLKIKNNVYDSYTHEYLGEYLRFMRDYNDINLMPLYNCFSNNICNNMNLTIKYILEDETTITTEFNSDDAHYKIYILPIKLFTEYTIAIDCEGEIDICCCLYDKYLNTNELSEKISKATLVKYTGMKFNNPKIYSKLLADSIKKNEFLEGTKNALSEITKYESILKMVIKVPANNESSIVVLEGNYSGYNNKKAELTDSWNLVVNSNKTITNFATGTENETFPDLEERSFNPISELQLLKLNTNKSHPFADRLIEYLLGNCITPEDSISDNVKRAQAVMTENKYSFKNYGAWDDKMKYYIYEFISNLQNTNSNAKLDCLGYVDKDVEKVYSSYSTKYILVDGKKVETGEYENISYKLETDDNFVLNVKSNNLGGEDVNLLSVEPSSEKKYRTKKVPKNTIANIDIYDDLYLDQKRRNNK